MALNFDITLTGNACTTLYVNDISNYPSGERQNYFNILIVKSVTSGDEIHYELDDNDNPKNQWVILQTDFPSPYADDVYRIHLFSVPVYATDPSPIEFPQYYILYDSDDGKLYRADVVDAHWGDPGDWTDISGVDPDDLYDYLRTFIDTIVIDDEEIPYEATKTLTHDCDVPEEVTNHSPEDGETNVSVTPTLSWDALDDAETYMVYLDTVDGSTFVAEVTGTSYSPGTLEYDTEYFWTIEAKNYYGVYTSVSTDIKSFTTVPETEDRCPVITAPADGSTNVGIRPVISWTDITSAGNIVMWKIDIHVASTNAVAYSQTVDDTDYPYYSHTVPAADALDYNTTYHLYISYQTVDGIWSSITDCDWIEFTTMVKPANAVECGTLVSPNDEYTLYVPNDITFTWNPVTNADHYSLLIYDNAGVLLNSFNNISNTTHTVQNEMRTGTIFWTVIPYNSDGDSPEGECDTYELILDSYEVPQCPSFQVDSSSETYESHNNSNNPIVVEQGDTINLIFDDNTITAVAQVYKMIGSSANTNNDQRIHSHTFGTSPGTTTLDLTSCPLEYNNTYYILFTVKNPYFENSDCIFYITLGDPPAPSSCVTLTDGVNPLDVYPNVNSVSPNTLLQWADLADATCYKVYFGEDYETFATNEVICEEANFFQLSAQWGTYYIKVVPCFHGACKEDCGIYILDVQPTIEVCDIYYLKESCYNYKLLYAIETDHDVVVERYDGTVVYEGVLDANLTFHDIELPEQDDVYIIKVGREDIGYCLPIYEFCGLETCMSNLVRSVLCDEVDTCEECITRNNYRFEFNKLKVLYDRLIELITFEKHQYLGVFTCSQEREERINEIGKLIDKIRVITNRCGECEENSNITEEDCNCT